jgi:hypothetical protein
METLHKDHGEERRLHLARLGARPLARRLKGFLSAGRCVGFLQLAVSRKAMASSLSERVRQMIESR